MNRIVVIDSIMGSGKTSWSIQHINECKEENFLYITPFLDEVERIMNSATRTFRQPINKGKGKLEAINDLLACEEDIASTHELFRHLDEESRTNIINGKYTLILDEVLNVIEPYDNIREHDMKLLKDGGCIEIDDDGFVVWNKEKMDYNTKYNDIKILADNRSLLYVNEKLLLWRYPPEIFTLFDKVYILTYLFEASVLKNYFDMYNIEYEKRSIKKYTDEDGKDKYTLTEFFYPDTAKYKELINIYQGNLNNNLLPNKETTLSATWFRVKAQKSKMLPRLKENLYNYFRNKVKAKSETIMWTVFKDYKGKIKGKGYTNGFLSCNSRSTNEYADRYNLAYCINVYMHPGIIQFFSKHGIEVDQNLFALSEMIQWIWRSRIRVGKPINIYIPSIRMRKLLVEWLDGVKKEISSTAA